ncbi:hypothetical protein CR513_38899, partial [Mucuna pruriens]
MDFGCVIYNDHSPKACFVFGGKWPTRASGISTDISTSAWAQDVVEVSRSPYLRTPFFQDRLNDRGQCVLDRRYVVERDVKFKFGAHRHQLVGNHFNRCVLSSHCVNCACGAGSNHSFTMGPSTNEDIPSRQHVRVQVVEWGAGGIPFEVSITPVREAETYSVELCLVDERVFMGP